MGSAAANVLRGPDPILNRAVFISGVKGVLRSPFLRPWGRGQGGGFTVEHVDVKKIKKEAEKA